MAASEPLKFHGLEISEAEIVERQHGQRMAGVPREAIRAIRLEHGIFAERPLRQSLFGLAVLLPGVFLGARLWWRFLTTPGPSVPRSLLVMPLFLAVLGGWALRDAMRRGWFLRVETEKEARKLRITGDVDRAALRAFFDRVHRELRYDVRDVPEP